MWTVNSMTELQMKILCYERWLKIHSFIDLQHKSKSVLVCVHNVAYVWSIMYVCVRFTVAICVRYDAIWNLWILFCNVYAINECDWLRSFRTSKMNVCHRSKFAVWHLEWFDFFDWCHTTAKMYNLSENFIQNRCQKMFDVNNCRPFSRYVKRSLYRMFHRLAIIICFQSPPLPVWPNKKPNRIERLLFILYTVWETSCIWLWWTKIRNWVIQIRT